MEANFQVTSGGFGSNRIHSTIKITEMMQTLFVEGGQLCQGKLAGDHLQSTEKENTTENDLLRFVDVELADVRDRHEQKHNVDQQMRRVGADEEQTVVDAAVGPDRLVPEATQGNAVHKDGHELDGQPETPTATHGGMMPHSCNDPEDGEHARRGSESVVGCCSR